MPVYVKVDIKNEVNRLLHSFCDGKFNNIYSTSVFYGTAIL